MPCWTPPHDWTPYAVCEGIVYYVHWYHRTSGRWYRSTDYRYPTLQALRSRYPLAPRAFWRDLHYPSRRRSSYRALRPT